MQKDPNVTARFRAARALTTLLCLAAVHGATPAAAQTAPQPRADSAKAARVVVSGSLGGATNGFLISGLSAGLFDQRRGWVLRASFAEEFLLFGPSPALSVWDVSFQRAAVSREGSIRATVAAGPALTGGMNRGRYVTSGGGWFGYDVYEEEPFLTVGLVGSLDITAAVLPFLGVGVEISGNANAERSYMAAAARVSVGGVR